MCCEHLLRGEVPYKVSNTETQEVREYNYLGHWDERDKDNTKHGFYTIGASGCGYMLYDGVIHFDNEVCRFAYKKDPNRTLLCDVIEFVEIPYMEAEVQKFLGTEKYQPLLDSIYKGLGIPENLTDGS